MQDKLQKIDLNVRKLKISEFVLGILVGIVVSTLIETISKGVVLTTKGSILIISVSISLLLLLYLWYKRIVGYPDYAEYVCPFNRNKKFDIKEFNVLFSGRLKENLRKNGYWAFDIYYYRGTALIAKVIGYYRSHISRKLFGTVRVFVYRYEKPERFRFLVAIPDFIGSHEGLINSLKDSLKELENKRVITKFKFSNPTYYHASWFSPLKKKGKKLI